MPRDNQEKIFSLKGYVENLSERCISPLDLLPHTDLREKLIDLVLNGGPGNIDSDHVTLFHSLRRKLMDSRVDDARVVVFGGGSGLSNVIGGDSRMDGWSKAPFTGLKEIFPATKSIVCVTDDGGSTGELIKDIPMIAIGDIRHVLLSSVQLPLLQSKYGLTVKEAGEVVAIIAPIFNKRFRHDEFFSSAIQGIRETLSADIPQELAQYLDGLLENILLDSRLELTSRRPHCLGNLLLASAVYKNISPELSNEDLEDNADLIYSSFYAGIQKLTTMIGAVDRAVLPCTTTPSQLRIRYSNGVQVTGENKSGTALRGYPVDRVFVDFSDTVHVNDQIFKDIENADIIIMAPGSLYSSIIPIFQVPGMVEAVRKNKNALKILISNLWVQAGETDKSILDPERKFHISDMIRAYERNIPGGTRDLFHDVLCLSLKDVPASILQNYAVEGKIPIYLDKNVVCRQGFKPIECGIYSKKALAERGVIQHDPEILAQAIKTIYVCSWFLPCESTFKETAWYENTTIHPPFFVKPLPSKKYREIKRYIDELPIAFLPDDLNRLGDEEIRESILDVIWKHQDIPLSHLRFFKGLLFLDKSEWKREQKWDKVFSFFDPKDSLIKIRSDQFSDKRKLEVAFLIALGQSLLGDYVAEKEVVPIEISKSIVGKVYHLDLKRSEEMQCFFNTDALNRYLELARMQQSPGSPRHFTRVINGEEGFTPPGMLMGLLYAWYLDNGLATHIEYKMSLMQISKSDLIPEQEKMLARRKAVIRFFRDVVFSS